MGQAATFKGYGPEQGYAKTRDAIAAYYKRNGIDVDADAIFISDGAKSDTGNITELFGHDNVILIPDPVYPVYVDSNTMCGNKVTYISGNADNDFLPMPDHSQHVDVIYICSPNNPTGACYNKEQLKEWVDYALENEAVILYDSAYEAFISDPELPRSIYAIEGARKCAIEFCSLSKPAGFTGTRCGYTVVPKELVFTSSDGREMSLNAMWNRRQSTKYNGTSYIVQNAAAAIFSEEGIKEKLEFWNSLGALDEDELLRRMELHLDDLPSDVKENKKLVIELIERRRRKLRDRLLKEHPEIVEHIEERRERLERRLEKQNPDAVKRLKHWKDEEF